MEDSSSSKPFMVTSSLNLKVTTPSFYNQPKKFASVAPPRPKSVTPPSAPSPTPIGTGMIGRVGEMPPPPPSLYEDFPPPPPPLDDAEQLTPPPVCFTTSPTLKDPHPAFPAPPPPAVDDLPLPDPPEEIACHPTSPSPPPPPPPPPPLPVPGASVPSALGNSPNLIEKQTSFDQQLDSLTDLLSEMENRGPFNPKLPSQYSAAPARQPSAPPPTAPKPALSFLPPPEMGDKPPPAPWAEELKARTNRNQANHSASAAPVPAPAAQPLAKGPSGAPKSGSLPVNQAGTGFGVRMAAPVAPKPNKNHLPAPFGAASPAAPTPAPKPSPSSSPAAPAPKPSPSSSPAAPKPTPTASSSPAAPAPKPTPTASSFPPPPPQPPGPPTSTVAPPAFNHLKKSPIGSLENVNPPPPPAQGPPPQPKTMTSPPSSFNQPIKSPSPSKPSPPGPVSIPGGGVPLSMREVEELERMTNDFIKDMDTHAPVITSAPTEVCGKCKESLSRTQPAVRAMDKLFHSDCFCCLSCHRPLQGMQFYDKDGTPECEDCYVSSLAVCSRCGEKITDRVLKAVGQCFHAHCFRCSTCSCSLEGAPFITDDNNNPYCVQDYHRRFSPLCVSCNEPIVPAPGSEETVRVVALDKNFHLKCYRCEDCSRPLSIEADADGCYPLDGKILCMKCHTHRAKQAMH